MRMPIALLLLCYLSSPCLTNGQEMDKWTIHGHAQGTTYSIVYYAEDDLVHKSDIDSILSDIDRSMSLYVDSSLINRFNNGIKSIEMDTYMQDVVRKAFEVHRKSKGLFDMTVKPLVDLWGFGVQKTKDVPSQSQIDQALATVGQGRLLRIKGRKLIKRKPQITIDLNGIAQGYSVDVLADYLSSRGIGNFLVELGGEIVAKGNKPDNSPFKVAINRPKEFQYIEQHIVALRNRAITTSGSYEKEMLTEQGWMSHHINPLNGQAERSSIRSVTVLADTAMDADAWDNVFVMMDPTEAVRFANNIKNIEIYIIYQDGSDFKEAYSDGFEKYLN